jgi:hypothetical protein
VVHAPPTGFNGVYKYRDLRKQEDAPLPQDWQRHEHPEGHYYTSKVAERADLRCSFPLPTASSPQEDHSENSQILLCTEPLLTTTLGPMTFLSYKCSVVGVTVHNAHGQAQLILPYHLWPEVRRDATCLLLAISEAEVADARRLTDWFSCALTEQSTRNDRAAPFYNVLWIEWAEHLAYRKALGIIRKTEWDALKAEVTTIRLG